LHVARHSFIDRFFGGMNRTSKRLRSWRLPVRPLLSTAELIKCVESGARDVASEENTLNALYARSDQELFQFYRMERAYGFSFDAEEYGTGG